MYQIYYRLNHVLKIRSWSYLNILETSNKIKTLTRHVIHNKTIISNQNVDRTVQKKWKGPFTVTKTSHKRIYVTGPTKVRQFDLTSVLSITPKTKDAYHKFDIESLQPDDIKFITTTSYTAIYITKVLLKSDTNYSSSKIQESIMQ